MSVLVVLTGTDSALVATDRRCIESNGQVRDDCPKTFRLPDASLVGGHTGLLRFSDRSVPQWLETLPLREQDTLEAVAELAKALFEEQMTAISSAEVGFAHRIANIVFVGRSTLRAKQSPIEIRAVVLRPNTATNQVVGEIRTFAGYAATGDDSAMAAVLKRIPCLKPPPSSLPRKRLKLAAKHLIATGIKYAEKSPNFPEHYTCGGMASVVCL